MQNMNAFNNCFVSLKLNGSDSEMSPMSFSIIEFDSIYQFYPKAKLKHPLILTNQKLRKKVQKKL